MQAKREAAAKAIAAAERFQAVADLQEESVVIAADTREAARRAAEVATIALEQWALMEALSARAEVVLAKMEAEIEIAVADWEVAAEAESKAAKAVSEAEEAG